MKNTLTLDKLPRIDTLQNRYAELNNRYKEYIKARSEMCSNIVGDEMHLLEKLLYCRKKVTVKLLKKFSLIEMLLHENTFEGMMLVYGKDECFPIFKKYHKYFSDKDYWMRLGDIYTTHDSTFKYTKDYKKLFSSKRSCREYLMRGKERKIFKNLPDQVTIYRGMSLAEFHSDNWGISWTLKKKIAEYFAYKYPILMMQKFDMKASDPRLVNKNVVEQRVNKNDLIAYLNDRNEEEVIYIKPAVSKV